MDITLEKVEESKKDVLYRLLQYSFGCHFERNGDSGSCYFEAETRFIKG